MSDEVKVKVKMPRSRARKLKDTKVMSRMYKAHENEVHLTNPTEFFNKISQPVESRLYTWMEQVRTSSEEMLDTQGISRLVEIDINSGKWRWRTVTKTSELRELLSSGNKAHETFLKLREANYRRFLSKNSREDAFGGFGFADDGGAFVGGANTGFPVRPEYTPKLS